MFEADHLRQIEAANRFRYPPAFWARRHELTLLAETPWFWLEYPDAALIGTPEALSAARRRDPEFPDDVIPFLVLRGEEEFPDYYGFERPIGGPPSPPNCRC